MNLFRYPWLFFGLYVLGFAVLSTLPRTAFPLIVAVYTAVFVLYGQMILTEVRFSTITILACLVAIRIPFFFNLPELSDDYFRFLWDGMLIHEGFNPFGRIPIQERISSMQDPEFAAYLLREMNSPGIGSVYPPFHQAVFGAGYLLSGARALYGVNAIRAIIVLTEIIFLFYAAYNFPNFKRMGIAYLLNPLVVIEGVGNLHFEAILVPWLAVSIFLFSGHRIISAAVALGGGILVKLTPLMLIPAFLARMSTKERIKYVVNMSIVLIVFFGMLEPWTLFGNLSDGYELYFTNFEFNASVYYLLTHLVSSILQYNAIGFIGPALGVLSLLFILFLSFRYRNAEFSELALVIYMVFLLFSTTVHPWYVLPVIYLASVSNRKWILLWSCTAIFSYSHYLFPIGPKWIFIVAEYGVLFGAILLEAKRKPWLQDELRG